MRHALLIFLLSVIGATNAVAEPRQNDDGYVVFELYTSQGCYSCPPADKILNKLTDHKNVIALGFHVTYWDYLSWKDTLGRGFSDQRQRLYAKALQARNIYTPQMIVNGTNSFVGSDKLAVTKALRQEERAAPVQLSWQDQNVLSLDLPELDRGNYTLWFFGVKASHTEDILRGENRGKEILYRDSVLLSKAPVSWSGKAERKKVSFERADNIDSIVVLAQTDGVGRVKAAGKIILP